MMAIENTTLAGLYSFREGLIHSIEHAPLLGNDLREKVLERLYTLEDGHKVCHGDFHPGNVLMTTKGAIVIDWMTARAGNPWANVARTSLLLTIGVKSAEEQIKPAIQLFVGLYQRAYLKRYLQLNPDKQNELRRWMPVIAAARLSEAIELERDALIKMVEEGVTG
jgi:aminoglycoside phosphotransferase (APT) family kinase protein